MVKEIKGRFGKCIICDCMDKKYGLPSLKDKSFDLCLTDPPYNINIKSKNFFGEKWKTLNESSIKYKDNLSKNEYKNWCVLWFAEIKRITNGQFIHCGKVNLSMWCNIKEIRDFIIHYLPNSFCNGSSSYVLNISPIVIYGKHSRIKKDLIQTNVNCGFMKKKQLKLKHPCPLDFEFWNILISQLTPKSVIDIFGGSGTTFEVCESLGINYFGYEINESYIPDIKKRIKNGMKRYKERKIIKHKGLI